MDTFSQRSGQETTVLLETTVAHWITLDDTFWFEAIASKLEAITSRLEAIAIRLEAIAIGLEAIAIRLDAIASRLDDT